MYACSMGLYCKCFLCIFGAGRRHTHSWLHTFSGGGWEEGNLRCTGHYGLMDETTLRENSIPQLTSYVFFFCFAFLFWFNSLSFVGVHHIRLVLQNQSSLGGLLKKTTTCTSHCSETLIVHPPQAGCGFNETNSQRLQSLNMMTNSPGCLRTADLVAQNKSHPG